MKELSIHDLQHISGAGLICAVAALPVAGVASVSGATMGAVSGFLGAYLQKKGWIECFKVGATTAATGAQMGIVLEKSAYHY